jgi:DNA-binding LytR/AlgR family response regulator
MNKLRIAACDDEPEILEGFVYIIKECFAYHNVPVSITKFNDPIVLAKALKNNTFDLLFLDIEMPRINGITLAKKLRELGSSIDIIYVSNKDDLVFKVFDVRPVSFIRKSRFFEEIGGVIRSYVANLSDEDVHKLVLTDKSEIQTLDLTKILYFEGAGKSQKAFMVDSDKPMEVRSTMQELEEKLGNKGFIRVHRGFLVNYQFIDAIRDSFVVLTTGYDIPLSRRNAHEVKDKFLGYMKWDNSTFC